MQVEDIENKLDLLIDMYRDDRMTNNAARWAQSSLPWAMSEVRYDDEEEEEGEKNDENGTESDVVTDLTAARLRNDARGGPPGSRSGSQFVGGTTDKQRSEPSTALASGVGGNANGGFSGRSQSLFGSMSGSCSRNPARPMLRNFSDLGPRIKKRVTYSSTSPVTNSSSSSALHNSSIVLSPIEQLRRGTDGRPSISGPRHQPSIVCEEDEDGIGMTGAEDQDGDNMSPEYRSGADDVAQFQKVGSSSGFERKSETSITDTERMNSGIVMSPRSSVSSLTVPLSLQSPAIVTENVIIDWADKNGKTIVCSTER